MGDSIEAFTPREFSEIYKDIYANLTEGQAPAKQRCTYILGGQPGAGKTSFFRENPETEDYIAINGDDYRVYHPNYEEIVQKDIYDMPQMTQRFCNAVVEHLISDLGDEGYNMVIEGTLRTPQTPITTCGQLKKKGYHTYLVVMACDAETAWESTLERAELMVKRGGYPRLVSIEIYNDIVKNIVKNLEQICAAACFDGVSVINREGVTLYPDSAGLSPAEVLEKELNYEKWERRFPEYAREFEQIQDALYCKNLKNS
ncbi:MAG: zeta toxin family protein [Roseburia sp.]|nr:zeta toxin family protein [Roseburia sp.]